MELGAVTINELFPAAFIVYLFCNSVAFFSFAADKRSAEKNRWRLSEKFLLLSAAAGPFGAYGSMKVFRHKTRTLKFYLVPVFLMVHVLVIAAILYRFYPGVW